MPLLTGTDGERKMSKSFDNYVGLTEPPGEMYGKTLSIPDGSLASWYELLLGTELPADVSPRDAKHALARQLVARFHGAGAAQTAEEAFDRQFIRHELPQEVPVIEWQAEDGVLHLPAVLSEAFGISTSEARRTIAQGGVRIDGDPVETGLLDLPAEALDGKIVQLGKRKFIRVRLV
jgi:tyrosyl-tRNA synthetase